jgi:hypothetical protein
MKIVSCEKCILVRVNFHLTPSPSPSLIYLITVTGKRVVVGVQDDSCMHLFSQLVLEYATCIRIRYQGVA